MIFWRKDAPHFEHEILLSARNLKPNCFFQLWIENTLTHMT